MLQELVKDLPVSVPEASEFNKLTVFGGKLEPRKPKEFDDPTLDAEESTNGDDVIFLFLDAFLIM